MNAEDLWERVEANVEWVERRAHEVAAEEADRTRALDTKASQVLAVSAVATSIAASVLVPRLASAPDAALWLAGLAAVSVLVSAGTAVYGLFPRAFLAFSAEEVEQWPTGDFLTQRPRDVQGRILNGWLENDCSCAHDECAQGDNGEGRADRSCPRPGIHDCYSRYHREEWRRRNPSRAGRLTREPVMAPSLPLVASSSRGRGSLQATVTAAQPDTGHLDPPARSDARS